MNFFKKQVLIFLFIVLLIPYDCFSFSLGDRLKRSENGDFIVTEQDKNFSVLIVRSVSKDSAILEEISAPVSAVEKNINWKTWVMDGAQGHTSWVMYEIDLQNFSLLESYSFTRRGWLFLDDSQHFLSRLLALDLLQVPQDKRKKTGPAPHSDEIDRRKIWNPTVKIEGKKTKLDCDVYKARWPKDDTLLSNCDIYLYFSKGSDSFSFPYWIEATNGHYTHAVKTIDSGKNLTSPLAYNLPRRPPKISSIKKTSDEVTFTIKSPAYYKNFSIYAFDITKPYNNIGPFTHETNKIDKETIQLHAKDSELSQYLKIGSRYKWVLIPVNSNVLYIESEDIFQWPSVSSK